MLQELEEAEIEMDILQKEHALQESSKDSKKEHQLPCLDSNFLPLLLLDSSY